VIHCFQLRGTRDTALNILGAPFNLFEISFQF
jgi:hypothetical protein